MVTADGTAKLLDLGLARPTDEQATRHTQTGMFVGSPYYASPEQITAGKTVDGRSDIYSLGASLYHMVTGQVPFGGETAMEVFTKHLREAPVHPKQVKPELSHEICAVIAKAMQKNRDERYQSIEMMARALEALPYEVRPELAGTRSIYNLEFVGPAPAREDAKSETRQQEWQELKEREAIVELARKPADYPVRCFGCGERVDIRATVPVKVEAAGSDEGIELLCEACMAEFPAATKCEMCGRNYDPRPLSGTKDADAVDTWVCPWCLPWHLSQGALAGAWLRREDVDANAKGDDEKGG